ncbi:hypothetical protein QBC35DRAFT_550608 [Podospora australis]|uniref:Uncharacterized protein n=1 Tax=Podospora australis TaxID=1536484 RepID=A0AAN7AGT3_9PEZI|nr:hypothetical protein QBC35DRAFT_550608 [Podospora australis]
MPRKAVRVPSYASSRPEPRRVVPDAPTTSAKGKKQKSPTTATKASKGKQTPAETSLHSDEQWSQQFMLGKSYDDLPGLGEGSALLMALSLPSQYPFPDELSFELMDGGMEGQGPKDASIRFYGPKYADKDELGIVHLMPLRAHRASHCSTRQKGTARGGQTPPHPQSFDKTVIDLTQDDDSIPHSEAKVTFREKKDPNETTIKDGHVYFHDTGIIYYSETLRLFLPFSSLGKNLMLLQIKDMATKTNGKPTLVALDLMIRQLTEPYFKDDEDKEEPSIHLGIKGIDFSLLEPLKAWAEKHDIKVSRMEQTFYNYAENTPMTGWMPIF